MRGGVHGGSAAGHRRGAGSGGARTHGDHGGDGRRGRLRPRGIHAGARPFHATGRAHISYADARRTLEAVAHHPAATAVREPRVRGVPDGQPEGAPPRERECLRLCGNRRRVRRATHPDQRPLPAGQGVDRRVGCLHVPVRRAGERGAGDAHGGRDLRLAPLGEPERNLPGARAGAASPTGSATARGLARPGIRRTPQHRARPRYGLPVRCGGPRPVGHDGRRLRGRVEGGLDAQDLLRGAGGGRGGSAQGDRDLPRAARRQYGGPHHARGAAHGLGAVHGDRGGGHPARVADTADAHAHADAAA